MRRKIDPVLQEIIEGAILAAEREMEDLVERTARSPLIRDQHDYRVGLFDRHGNKLTGRSYSALVDPILKRFPLEGMREGDVFLHNDCYLSEGGIGHLPDLCSTVPILYGGEVAAFALVFGHHDDVGGMVPGSMPTYATEIYQEGILVPPIRLYEADALNRAAYDIIFRNSRLGEHLRADIDAEIGACRAGAERVVELFRRYGKETVFACFEALLDKCAETLSRELLSKIPDGTYAWEDYIESDGVTPDQVHRIRLSMTKRDGKLILDFNGTDPQARGPINWPSNYADGKFLKKWIGPILRNLADTPERANEIDVNEGICRLIEVRFPPEGTLITPRFPAPTNMRMFTILRLLGIFCACIAQAVDGNVPADQETIRYWGFHGRDEAGDFFLFREILGGGSGGRPYADGTDAIHIVPNSRNLPAEFSESRYPVRIEKLGLCPDSGGPGKRRGGLGYFKEYTALVDAMLLSNADRSRLACWGVKGGKAGGNYRIVLNPDTPRERALPALCDNVPVKKGDRIRVITTGGGGWGDPLDREAERVQIDVVQGKVTREGAGRDYGVVLGPGEDRPIDHKATEALRKRLRRTRKKVFFDRGEYYEKVVRGQLERRGKKKPARKKAAAKT
ncbi:MAG: hydantoinase B/oxoprolinase family protein [Candidatus Tectomicrobia bacterium]|nr:hydantoinase B/oxoprolinase family protein [Candidatus Tectomicrobia bacterium]